MIGSDKDLRVATAGVVSAAGSFPLLCFVRALIHLVGEWASNHTPGGLLGGRMDIEPCPGQLKVVLYYVPSFDRSPLQSLQVRSRQAFFRRGVNVYKYIGVSLQFLLFEHTDLSTGSFRVLYFPMPFRYTMSRLSLSRF